MVGVSKLTFKTLLEFFLMVGIGGGKGKIIGTKFSVVYIGSDGGGSKLPCSISIGCSFLIDRI